MNACMLYAIAYLHAFISGFRFSKDGIESMEKSWTYADCCCCELKGHVTAAAAARKGDNSISHQCGGFSRAAHSSWLPTNRPLVRSLIPQKCVPVSSVIRRAFFLPLGSESNGRGNVWGWQLGILPLPLCPQGESVPV
ncbi:hypothetical protein GUJ93_ZPchr0002g22965 [Zizania palustris]|uniref:Uncharacterized protein n=1 Tax=Zizania palustris TaxID=103762 RepID=A0A8J5RUD5_ZIZPA|nr:hypothetical protein GUJ93_ZPchr0002g22965 [Zizania palustris]